MFNKKSCPKCGTKVSSNYDFCPKCGKNISSKKESLDDFGMFGKDDFFENERKSDFEPEIKLPFGFNTIFNSLMKNLDKQFKELNKELIEDANRKQLNPSFKKANSIKINISAFGNEPPRISVDTSGKIQNKKKEEITRNKLNTSRNNFSEAKIQKLLTLPRKEPASNLKRLSDKIIYEINLPDVNSIDDILISQLENSIEIKAVGKNNSYLKLLPINLPITNHKFSNGKLILELMN